MFDSKESVNADKIYNDCLEIPVRQLIANAVFAACKYSLDWKNKDLGRRLPRNEFFKAACDLRYVINRFLVHQIEDNPVLNMRFSEKLCGKGCPVAEFHKANVTFHVKKNNNINTLPQKADYRQEKSTVNQIPLDFGENFTAYENIYMIATYNHINFTLKYLQIGIPSADYSHWAGRWDLMSYIKRDDVDHIIKRYGLLIRQDIDENDNIRKSYKLSVK